MYLITATPPEKSSECHNLCKSVSLPKFHSVFRAISGDILDLSHAPFHEFQFNYIQFQHACVEEDSKMDDFTERMSQVSLNKT